MALKREILEQLQKITPEEEKILSGEKSIEKDIYMSDESNVIDAKKLLDTGKLIQIRTHTRFIHFPEHTHNYVEMIYMCSGSTHHVINGEDVILKQGELLMLNQNAVQEIYPAGADDVAVNFIILPEFFDYGLKMIEEEENLLRTFIIDCLRGENGTSGYMHFKVAEILPVQNLVENLIWTVMNHQTNKRSINQATMGLLFLQLMNHMDRMDTDLVQAKRLNQAAYLLRTTSMNVIDIAMAVGYDNISYFHRIFQKKYGMTPKKYRDM